jgi:phosphoglycerate dehydrogenase-like enzyme
MFDARRFGLMKQGAYFIVVSRGKLYDAGALGRRLNASGSPARG